MLAQPAIARSIAMIAQVRNAGAKRTASVAAFLFPAAAAIKAPVIPRRERAAFCESDNGFDGGICAWLLLGACTVTVVVTEPLEGFTLGGLKLQAPPGGRLEHDNASGCLNPLIAVTVIVNFPEDPAVSVSAEVLIESV